MNPINPIKPIRLIKPIKLIHFSDQSSLEKYQELSQFRTEIEVSSNVPPGPAGHLLKGNYDIIELASGDFQNFKSIVGSLDVKTSRLGVADCLIKINADFRPAHLISESVYKAILQKVPDLKNSESAVIIGDYDFVLAMAYKLAQAGFFNLIIATDRIAESQKIKKLVKMHAFGIEIQTVPLNELTQLESGSVLLVSNLNRKSNIEAYESLTYFNFLSRGAAFVDLNSRNEAILAEEARRAEIIMIEEIDILQIKYQTIIEIFKNSPFV